MNILYFFPNVSWDDLRHDFSSSIVVFLVALPLCIGVAFASGTPIVSGLISGIVGGIVISLISKSPLSVSGPAMGLTVIVFDSIQTLGSFNDFLFAFCLAGVLQITLGFLKAGILSNFFPSSVIKGMLAAIGAVLILKQIPHAIGYDMDYEGDMVFFQQDQENTFSEILAAFHRFTPGAIVLSSVSLVLILIWEKLKLHKKFIIHGSLVAILVSVLLNEVFKTFELGIAVGSEHMIQPIQLNGITDFFQGNHFPSFSQWKNQAIYLTAIKICLVMSLETLLNLDAIEKLDPQRRIVSKNRELVAQGTGNLFSAILGGLPITSVIIRSSTNLQAGAKTRFSAFLHGLLILLSLILIPTWISKIPLASLAAVLLVVGYKLTDYKIFQTQYRKGMDQFVPFVSTLIGIVFSDVLIGIGIGCLFSVFFIVRRNILNPYEFNKKEMTYGVEVKIDLSEDVSFLNKSSMLYKLDKVPDNAHLIIDGSKSKYIDPDVLEIIEDFKIVAEFRNIKVEIIDVTSTYQKIKNKPLDPIIQQDYQKLFENNRIWVEEKLLKDPNYFKNLALGQTPKYLLISCSDSRISVNEMTGTNAGELFVHRNIANLVIDTDMNLMSVLQYSVEVLKVKHIVVCGHYGCGGVKAAIDGKYHGLIDAWLRHIKQVYRMNRKELSGILDEDEKHKKLVELNVREQVYNLCMTTIVQNAWSQGNDLQLHGWVYNLQEGILLDLNIDINKDFSDYDIFRYKFETR
ncbi:MULTISPECIES: SulP family inorganic anion transporter [Leptospira]|uniref:Carbonic anhydrase 2 n=3 Tax=Leptospira weilii TaxID=28184 RepID=A0A828Z3V2_9LEPT|nr:MULTISPECIES: SulP family inorganic anion transporter [Leptospira]EMY12173.1 inorganic anion transporter, SulP family [Leptospira weilii str. Ecochallenge]EKR64585.1 inorganic anion transporter, SulP family [Leptospira weilii str. 2006001853]EMJ67127.1 inorganic anion transporter, SulP family [Leptospira sp. P2653]EMN43647.1 inorganic anion transporter, SulP family [Leptospira weilii str. LNT 1234]EMN89353.1 inorganic anion transporter, SulP family [Leptospira weilii str. UI 13098]